MVGRYLLAFAVSLALFGCGTPVETPNPDNSSDVFANTQVMANVEASTGNVSFEVVQIGSTTGELSYFWDFGDETTAVGSAAIENHKYAEDGSYDVVLIITDGQTRTTLTKTVMVTNTQTQTVDPIVAAFTMQQAGDTIMVNAANSSFDDSTTVEYLWDFGDGITSNSSTHSHTYLASGDYTVSLTLSDVNGVLAASTVTQAFTAVVGPTDAEVTVKFDSTINGRVVSLDATGSSTTTNNPLVYSWTLGDGSMYSEASFDHTFSDSGDFIVSLIVSAGEFSNNDKQTLNIANNAPEAVIEIVQQNGHQVMLSASGSTDADSDPLTFSWLIDGKTFNTSEVAYDFISIGEHSIELSVLDNQLTNNKGTDSISINVESVPVVLNANFTTSVTAMTVSVDATASTGDGDITYSWDFGEQADVLYTSQSLDYTFAQPGTHTITLTVTSGAETHSVSKDVVISAGSAFVGDIERGKALYEGTVKQDGVTLNCSLCHGDTGEGDNPLVINAYLVGSKSIFDEVSLRMPVGNVDACTGQCAADIEAYLLTWEPIIHEVLACGDRLTYGARQIKLLTREEYQNSMTDLVGIDFDLSKDIPDDTYIHGFSNNIKASATEVHIDSYMTNAERVAAWSKQNNFAGVADCSGMDTQACADEFINGFATKAFRRPLTNVESNAIRALFADTYTEGDLNVALEMGMTSVLTSPGFLYRSEQGKAVKASEIDGGQYEFAGNSTAYLATDFTDIRESFPELSTVSGSVVIGATPSNGAQPAKLGKHLNYSGQGTLVQVSMRAVLGADGSYPQTTIKASGYNETITVDWEEFRTISFYFPDLTNSSEFSFNKSPTDSKIEFYEFEYGPAQLKPNSPDADAFELTPYEIASYLSYTYTGSTPDDQLMQAAANNELQTDAQIALQIDRLLANPKAITRMGNFAAQWLGTDDVLTEAKDTDRYPELTDEIRRAMAQEVRELFTHIIFDETQSIESFYNADYAFVNSILAGYYNLDAVSGNGFSKVSGKNERGGVLTTGAFHVTYATADEASPIYRAVAVRERLLCQDIPPPPAGVNVGREAAEDAAQAELDNDWLTGNMTNARRYHLLTQGDGCVSCHAEIINPLGFGMEDYDTIGRYRTLDLNNQTIDATGTLYGIENMYDFSTSLSFTGSKGLSDTLGDLENVKECFVGNMFRYALGVGHEDIDLDNPSLGELTEQEIEDYSCSIVGMNESMIESNGDPKVMLRQLGALKLVRYRKELER